MNVSTKIDLVRVFLASPGDVETERGSVEEVIRDININSIRHHNVVVELIKWETHTHAALGRPQGIINEQIGEYDVFIGVMWNRFGTPTGVAGSGTEEEFRVAYASWEQRGSPEVMLYFCSDPMPDQSLDALKQKLLVEEFKEEIADKGLFFFYQQSEFKTLLSPSFDFTDN